MYKHKTAYVKSTMDTTIACYVVWVCDCGKKLTESKEIVNPLD